MLCIVCVIGLKTPDTAQYEGLKLLCSLVMMLLGNGFYGAPGPNTDARFVDQGTTRLPQIVIIKYNIKKYCYKV